jgi:hypothetical protein
MTACWHPGSFVSRRLSRSARCIGWTLAAPAALVALAALVGAWPRPIVAQPPAVERLSETWLQNSLQNSLPVAASVQRVAAEPELGWAVLLDGSRRDVAGSMTEEGGWRFESVEGPLPASDVVYWGTLHEAPVGPLLVLRSADDPRRIMGELVGPVRGLDLESVEVGEEDQWFGPRTIWLPQRLPRRLVAGWLPRLARNLARRDRLRRWIQDWDEAEDGLLMVDDDLLVGRLRGLADVEDELGEGLEDDDSSTRDIPDLQGDGAAEWRQLPARRKRLLLERNGRLTEVPLQRVVAVALGQGGQRRDSDGDGAEGEGAASERVAATADSNSGASTTLGFHDGSWLSVVGWERDPEREGDRWSLQLEGGQSLAARGDQLRSELAYARPANDRVRFLSDEPPADYRHIPYLSVPRALGRDATTIGTRLRAPPASGPQRSGPEHSGPQRSGPQRSGPQRSGQRALDERPWEVPRVWHEKGLGMHVSSRVAYRLPGRFQRLQAELAIDRSAGSEGSALFRVMGRGGRDEPWRELAEGPWRLRGGEAPRPIDVDIRDLEQLVLLVDATDRGGVLGKANWLMIRLVRAEEASQ